jgi:branched-chain amino acid transport system substrate-binding protein
LIIVTQFQKPKESTENVIKIGAILPLTGSAAEIAEQHKQGIDFAVDEINKNGGIRGRKIQLIYEDDKNDPKLTVSAFNKLADIHKIPIIITVMSSPSMAIYPLADQKKVILFANCGHPEITKLSKWVFRNFPTSQQEAQVMVEFVKDMLKINSLSILYINDIFGEGAMKALKIGLENYGLRIISIDSFEKDSSDFRALITKVINLKPDAIYIYGYGKANGLIIRQIRESGYEGILLGSYNFSVEPTLSLAKEALEGSYFTMPYFDKNTNNEIKINFLNEFINKYKKDPEWNTVIEYDAINLIAKVIGDNGYSPELIKKGLEETNSFEGIMGRYKQINRNEWQCNISVKTIKNGKIISIQ